MATPVAPWQTGEQAPHPSDRRDGDGAPARYRCRTGEQGVALPASKNEATSGPSAHPLAAKASPNLPLG